MYIYKTSGVCASEIHIEIDGDIIQRIEFFNGCDGSAKGVAKLAVGKSKQELIELLGDITCGGKNTSCPAQLAKALKNLED